MSKNTKAQAAKGKKGKGKNAKPRSAGVSIAAHPRATRSIHTAKSYAGLAAFLLAGYVSWKSGGVFLDVATRALLWGIAAYVLVWALAVQVWRQIAIAEVKAAEERYKELTKAPDPEQVAKLTKALEDSGMPTTGLQNS